MSEFAVRWGTPTDLELLQVDGVPVALLLRKIEAQEVFVAEQHGRPVGYLRLEYLWSKRPYIAHIWVEEGRRQSGIGRALLTHVEEMLRGQGHTVLYSSSEVDASVPQAWHRKMGFLECGILAGVNDGDVGEVFFRKPL